MVQVVDTTGAGDCFTGAMAVGMLEGKSYQEAMQFAGIACFLFVTLITHGEAATVCLQPLH